MGLEEKESLLHGGVDSNHRMMNPRPGLGSPHKTSRNVGKAAQPSQPEAFPPRKKLSKMWSG